MKQKIIQILGLWAFIVIFGYFFGDEYWEYQDIQNQENNYHRSLEDSLQAFSIDSIWEISGDMQLYKTPDLGLLTQLVDEIDAAKEKIYVEVYIFTERDMRDALIRAHNRWIEVKILLENNPYKAPYLNDKHYEAFQNAWLDVKWSDPLNYSLNHAKMMIIDEKVYISTWNFSYSLFKYNQDFLVSVENTDFIEKLEALFIWDFEHKNIGVYDTNLVISPSDSRFKLEQLVLSAKESVRFYFPYIADERFENTLFKASQKWVNIQGIVAKDFYNEENDVIERFERTNIEMSFLKKDKLHAKAMLIDESILYIGSINFSTYSFDENREIGLIIKDKKIIEDFKNIFNSDL